MKPPPAEPDPSNPIADAVLPLSQSRDSDDLPRTMPGFREGTSECSSVPLVTRESEAISTTRYRLRGEIARGGMGIVYRAHDIAFNRDVALKTIQQHFGRSVATHLRFVEEACITGQLQHPNIPSIHELGTLEDGRPFLVMKLIRGETLSELLRRRARPQDDPRHFLGIFEQICQAVAYAHSHQVIHRDLKPGNVMVGAFGEVQVMDWGLAKVLRPAGDSTPPDPRLVDFSEIRDPREDHPDMGQTQAGAPIGTLSFIPPEQATGDLEKVDRRSDVFGLGGILCAILTGQPPYVADTAARTRVLALRADLSGAYARLEACGAERELIDLARRCLSVEVEDRPGSAAEVAGEIARLREADARRLQVAEIDRARSEVQTDELRKRARMQRVLFGAFLALVGSLALIAVEEIRQDRDRLEYTIAEQNRAIERERERDRARFETLIVDVRRAWSRRNFDSAAVQLSGADERLRDRLNDEDRRTLDSRLADNALLRELEANRRARLGTLWSDEPVASVRERYATIFRRIGMDFDREELDALAGTLSRNPLFRPFLQNYLEDWGLIETDPVVHSRLWHAIYEAFGKLDIPEAEKKREDWRIKLPFDNFQTDRARLEQVVREVKPFYASPAFFLMLAKGLENTGGDAIDAMEEACRQNPWDIVGCMNLGRLLESMDPPDDRAAGAVYRAGIQIDPDRAVAHANLARVLARRGELVGAIREYREAFERDRSFESRLARRELARACEELAWRLPPGHPARAARHAEALQQRLLNAAAHPNRAESHYEVAASLMDAGRIPEAIHSLIAGVRLDPIPLAGQLLRGLTVRLRRSSP